MTICERELIRVVYATFVDSTAYPEPDFWQQAAANLPWGHIMLLRCYLAIDVKTVDFEPEFDSYLLTTSKSCACSRKRASKV